MLVLAVMAVVWVSAHLADPAAAAESALAPQAGGASTSSELGDLLPPEDVLDPLSGRLAPDESQLYSGLSSYWSLIRLEKRLWQIQSDVNFFVSSRRILVDRWVLDRVVRSPYTLHAATHLAMERAYRDWMAFLLKLRARYSSAPHFHAAPFYTYSFSGSAPWHEDIAFPKASAQLALNKVTALLNENLDEESLWDLSVYLLAHATGLRTDWDRVLTSLLASEWTLATAVLVTTSLSNQGKIGSIVRLWQDESGLLRLGLRTDLTKLGVSLEPRLRMGFIFETPEYVVDLTALSEWADIEGQKLFRGLVELALQRDRSFRRLAQYDYVARLHWRSGLMLPVEPNSRATPWSVALSYKLDLIIQNRGSGTSPKLTLEVLTADTRVTTAAIRFSLRQLRHELRQPGNPIPQAFEFFVEAGRGLPFLLGKEELQDWHFVMGAALNY